MKKIFYKTVQHMEKPKIHLIHIDHTTTTDSDSITREITIPLAQIITEKHQPVPVDKV